MTRNVIVPAAHKRQYENFHFAPAVRAGDLLICSGQIGLGPTGIPEAAEEEFRNAWRSIGVVLAEAGLDYPHIIEYTTFHVGLQKHIQEFMKVRDEFISEPWPAWTAIGCTELAVPGARVEIRVIALG